MKDDLVRFGIAMEPALIAELDALAEARECNRSELLRDLARAEVSRARVSAKAPAFATVTLVYNHHVRELSERLTSLQHELGEQVRSTMHVHLDRENCLEVIVMRGRSDQLRQVASRMVSTRGVIHGGAEYIAEDALHLTSSGRRTRHEHEHEHHHEHEHDEHHHQHEPAKKRTVRRRAKSPRKA
jgi:CopG family nickel-responsive transcriptional regulator